MSMWFWETGRLWCSVPARRRDWRSRKTICLNPFCPALSRSSRSSQMNTLCSETIARIVLILGPGGRSKKDMYILKTKGGDTLALRPEFTPSIARAYLEHSLSRLGQPQKLYHMGPVFRHDRPQLGRFRQFSQVGFEILGGINDPIYDAQI